MHTIKKTQGGNLPHWHAKDGIYFVTFRLENSMPRSVVELNKSKQRDILADAKKNNRELTIWELDELEDLHFQEMDFKHHDKGACFMFDETIAKIVADALLHFHKQRYVLYAWCVMPNHVHAVVQPNSEKNLSEILQSWKGFSARKANTVLGRKGAFWQQEGYDHLIRNAADVLRCIEYTWMNPEKAGLKNWKWRGKDEQAIAKLLQSL